MLAPEKLEFAILAQIRSGVPEPGLDALAWLRQSVAGYPHSMAGPGTGH